MLLKSVLVEVGITGSTRACSESRKDLFRKTFRVPT